VTLIAKPDGAEAYEHTFDPGTVFAVGDALGPGLYGARVDGVDCAGVIQISAEEETDVLIDVRDGCRLVPDGRHPADAVHAFGSVGGHVRGIASHDARVAIRSTDVPATVAPFAVTVDESATYYVPTLPPGAYELVLKAGTQTIARRTVTVDAGSSAVVDFEG
jgi:hypothetical protein